MGYNARGKIVIEELSKRFMTIDNGIIGIYECLWLVLQQVELLELWPQIFESMTEMGYKPDRVKMIKEIKKHVFAIQEKLQNPNEVNNE